MLKGCILDKRINKEFKVKCMPTVLRLDMYFSDGEGEIGDEYRQWFDGADYSSVNGDSFRRLVVNFDANKYKTNFTDCVLAAEIAGTVKHCVANTVMDEQDSKLSVVTKKWGEVCECRYRQGILEQLYINTPKFEISMEVVENEKYELMVFKSFKEKDEAGNILSNTPIKNKGYKITEDLLGFAVVETEVKGNTEGVGKLYTSLEEVYETYPDKNFRWLSEQDYRIVTDDILEDVIEEFKNHDGPIAFDTETTGLKINFLSRVGMSDVMTGVVLCKEEGVSYYFPLRHNKIPNLCNGDDGYFMEKYMRKLLENKPIITHNASFDWKVGHIYGINVNVVFDTMYAIRVTLGAEFAEYPLGLKLLTKAIFGLDQMDLGCFVDTSWGDAGITFADLPYEFVRVYAPTDGDMTLRLYNWIMSNKIIEKYNARKVVDLEVDFGKVVGYSEFYGYKVAVEAVQTLKTKILEQKEKYRKKMMEMVGKDALNELYAKFGKEFNPNSVQHLCFVMYDKLKYPEGKKRSTNKEYLKELAVQRNVDGDLRYPFCRVLLDYRINDNIYKNFIVRLDEEECKKANAKGSGKKKTVVMTKDGFIFPEVNTIGAETGRVSTKEPNYQSYNDVVKQHIVPRQAYVMVDCDFSQIEQRVLASMAKETKLMDAMNDSEMDYHQYQASRMFSVPYAAVTKELRQQSKGINFGLPYGMEDASLGARIFGKRTKETELKAAKLRKLFFEGQENIERFFKEVRDFGVESGYTETFIGRRRYYRSDKYSEKAIRRQAGNAVIQGSAADIYKMAVVRLFNRVAKKGWLGLVLFNAFVHDELLMEVHKSINMYEFMKLWREEYQVSIKGFCKLYAGYGVGMNWYKAKKQDLEPLVIDYLIEKYETEKPKWDGDFEKYIQYVESERVVYYRNRVKEYITDKENEGTVLKPGINAMMQGLLIDDIKNVDFEVFDEAVKHVGYSSLVGVEKDMAVTMLKDVKFNVNLYRELNGISQEVSFKNIGEVSEKSVSEDCEIKGTDVKDYTEKDMYELHMSENLGRCGFYEEEDRIILSEDVVKRLLPGAIKAAIVREGDGGRRLSMYGIDCKIKHSKYYVADEMMFMLILKNRGGKCSA